MCVHKLYIFATCGHRFFAPTPVRRCDMSSSEPPRKEQQAAIASQPTAQLPGQDTNIVQPQSTCQDRKAHPYHSYILHRLCRACERQREARLADVYNGSGEVIKAVRVDEWRWKVAVNGHSRDEASSPSPCIYGSGRRGDRDAKTKERLLELELGRDDG